MSQPSRPSEDGLPAGGPPPGWPTAAEAPPPADGGAFAAGMTLHGEPNFLPAFPPPDDAPPATVRPLEPINPFGVTGAMDPAVAPAGATVVEPPAPSPYALGPTLPHAGVAPQPAAIKPPKSRVPLLVGILAIAVGVTSAIGFFVYQRQKGDAGTDATVDVPKKKKKKAAASATATAAAPAPAPDPTPEPSAEEPEAEPSAEPEPTTTPSSQPKPPASGSSTPKPPASGSSTPKPPASGSSTPKPPASGGGRPISPGGMLRIPGIKKRPTMR